MIIVGRARAAILPGFRLRKLPGVSICAASRPGALRPSTLSRPPLPLAFSTSRAGFEKQRLQPQPRPQPPSPQPPAAQKPTIHEDIWNVPNILTFSRLIASPFVGYFILHDQHALALGLFAYAGVTDMLDGWIARRWNKRTVVGTVIDPMADKTLMTILTVCLAIKGGLPLWVASVILLRDVGLAISAIYYRWISLPAPKTFSRYWDFSLPSAEITPTTISKANTALQLLLVGLATAAPVSPYDLTSVLSVLHYVVATTTVWSGASYVYTKDAVKILNQAAKPKGPP